MYTIGLFVSLKILIVINPVLVLRHWQINHKLNSKLEKTIIVVYNNLAAINEFLSSLKRINYESRTKKDEMLRCVPL